ncbi:hydrogenase small subunit [Thermodesulfovibrionales bacterium]|nr:hydrogenase small subunit [Thermodesulfovibrionales bacterium]MCL0074730.1 hydrogenase small subunit [Thermodesulfovibrionales bacterium]
MECHEVDKNGKKLGGGVSRRDFLKFCAVMAASIGLPLGAGSKVAEAITDPNRPPVIWLSFSECTGCVMSLLQAHHPTLDTFLLDLISLDYTRMFMTTAGHTAIALRNKSIEENKGKFILVVEGAIPTKDNGIYCKIGGRTALDILKDVGPKAAFIIALGSCTVWGGAAAATPNPTGLKGVDKILTDKTVINLTTCPPSPYNLLSTVIHLLTFNELPALDDKGRPKFAYARTVCNNCERVYNFRAGRFAWQFGDEGHKKGYCLFALGCKGPQTFSNCPSILFGGAGAETWCVGIGHPCCGCAEEGVGWTLPLHQLGDPLYHFPPSHFARIDEPVGMGATAAAAAVVAGSVGIAVGAGAVLAKRIGDDEKKAKETSEKEDVSVAKEE